MWPPRLARRSAPTHSAAVRTSRIRVGPSGLAASRLQPRTCSYVAIEVVVAIAQRGRRAEPVGEVGLGHLGRGLAARPAPGFDPAVEDVDPVGWIAIQAEEPVTADRLPVHPDVVVEDDPIAVPDSPAPERARRLIGRRDQPLALGVAGLGSRSLERELLVQVAVRRARDVALVVHAPIGRDMDEPKIRIGEVLGEPGRRHEGTRLRRGARLLRRGGGRGRRRLAGFRCPRRHAAMLAGKASGGRAAPQAAGLVPAIRTPRFARSVAVCGARTATGAGFAANCSLPKATTSSDSDNGRLK